jgi:hypothetical protein
VAFHDEQAQRVILSAQFETGTEYDGIAGARSYAEWLC